MKKSKDANWSPGGVHLDFRIWTVSKVSLFEMLESSSMSWKKAFNWTQRRNFSTSRLTENWSIFLEIGTKFKPLLRTGFSESESGKFSGMVTTVLRFSGDESLVIWGPIRWSSSWALIWSKWLKSFEFASWILARIGYTKTAGQILESSERQWAPWVRLSKGIKVSVPPRLKWMHSSILQTGIKRLSHFPLGCYWRKRSSPRGW